MRRLLLGLLLGTALVAPAVAGEVKVINPDAWFPEGPAWYQGKLYYVEYGRNTVMTWDGTKTETFWRQDGCGPSAVIPTPAGEFLVTCYDNGTIGRISADGKTLTPYAKTKDGQGFVGPNDIVVDAKGGVFFTASGHEGPVIDAAVYRIAPDGTVTLAAANLHNANGLALSNDGKTLYVIETEDNRLLQFAVHEDGSLSDRRVFLRLDDLVPGSVHIWPDGMKIDAKGEIYLGQSPRSLDAPGKILVVSADGTKLLRTLSVPSPSMPNLAFGPGEKVVYVMALDQIDKAPWHGKVYEVPNE
jgi:sugar lactone lactonase YvrE